MPLASDEYTTTLYTGPELLPRVHEGLEDGDHEVIPEPTAYHRRFDETPLSHYQGVGRLPMESPLATFRKRYESPPQPPLKKSSFGRKSGRKFGSCFPDCYGNGPYKRQRLVIKSEPPLLTELMKVTGGEAEQPADGLLGLVPDGELNTALPSPVAGTEFLPPVGNTLRARNPRTSPPTEGRPSSP